MSPRFMVSFWLNKTSFDSKGVFGCLDLHIQTVYLLYCVWVLIRMLKTNIAYIKLFYLCLFLFNYCIFMIISMQWYCFFYVDILSKRFFEIKIFTLTSFTVQTHDMCSFFYIHLNSSKLLWIQLFSYLDVIQSSGETFCVLLLFPSC